MRVCFLATFVMMLTAALPGFAAMTVALTPSLPDPVSVATQVTWTAALQGSSSGTIWYRFRARFSGQTYQLVRDFGPKSTLDWTPTSHEGSFEIEVAARNLATGETAQISSMYQIVSR